MIVGGGLCAIAQVLIDKTKLTPARILVGYVVAGVILAFAFGETADLVIRIAGAILAVTGIIELAGNIAKK